VSCGDFNEFANISVDANGPPLRKSELEEYLQLPVENIKDPLKWWVNNQRVYPNLSLMALDYLSIPGNILSVSSVCCD
jgi:hypothetical protein